jgi:FlaA1/EpsC-like NDP-sugar epimerase
MTIEKISNFFRQKWVSKSLRISFHLFAVLVAFLGAFSLRFELKIPAEIWSSFYKALPIVISIKLTVFWFFGIYEGWWRYVSIPDFIQIFKANLVSTILLVLFFVFVNPSYSAPRSVIILDFLLCFTVVIGVRISLRVLREYMIFFSKGKIQKSKSVLIVGSGSVAQSIVREIRQNPKLNKSVLGYIDKEVFRQGKVFSGVPVVGTLEDFDTVCTNNEVDLVIVAQSAVSHRELLDIVSQCKKYGINLKILPTINDVIDGRVSLQQCRPVQPEDLLGRSPVQLDLNEMRQYFQGKRILVTGAAGSIGSQICRMLAQFDPQYLILFETAETPLFQLEKDLKGRFPGIAIDPCLADIRDERLVFQLLSEKKPQVVFHCAAYKHVPMSQVNPVEVVKNNVLGTKIMADVSRSVGAEKFVFLSTIKAVHPTTIMGVTKRVAEIYVQNLPRDEGMRAVTVRFANVLGSQGSVIPVFMDKISRGEALTVTHPEMTRFFMTIPEAVQLVLQAACMGEGGEIFLLDMGDPVKIVWLAEEMIRLSGLRPYQDIEIVFTGPSPGEQLIEELSIEGDEVVKATRHEKIRVLEAKTFPAEFLREGTDRLLAAMQTMDAEKVLNALTEIVPDFPDSSHRSSVSGKVGDSVSEQDDRGLTKISLKKQQT